jgi:hypothetical protein
MSDVTPEINGLIREKAQCFNLLPYTEVENIDAPILNTHHVIFTVNTEDLGALCEGYGLDRELLIANSVSNEVVSHFNNHARNILMLAGWHHNYTAYRYSGRTANISFDGTDATKSFPVSGGTLKTIPCPAISSTGTPSLQYEILKSIEHAIGTITTHGSGIPNVIVTNVQIASALQDVAQFSFALLPNTINQNTGSIYRLGDLLVGEATLDVYVDPYMDWSDTRILVARVDKELDTSPEQDRERKDAIPTPGYRFYAHGPVVSLDDDPENKRMIATVRYAIMPGHPFAYSDYYTIGVHAGQTSIF